jgi:hypothetical protein
MRAKPGAMEITGLPMLLTRNCFTVCPLGGFDLMTQEQKDNITTYYADLNV